MATRSGATENAVNPSIDNPISRAQAEGGAAVGALFRFIIDADLPEADPARQSLEEAVALRQLAQCVGGARREQAKVAGILRYLAARAPVDEQIERLHRDAPRKRLVGAMRLGGIDHVIAAIEPVADQRFDQRRRMLAVAVDEQNRAEPGMIEAGEQRRLLAEIARQRDHLHVERVRRQGAGDGQRVVAAAVVDIDHFAGQRALGAESARDFDEPRVQTRERGRFVVERNHDREAGGAPPLRARFCSPPLRSSFRRGFIAQPALAVAQRAGPANRRLRRAGGRWSNMICGESNDSRLSL